ncbi:hypothetical protein G7Z17_g1889 [Cylindrodendrum hubeiense]|uniref:Uncharacterized protein n=1 Tax=Cylindrodendrum hubeiense TaxID=595255 RepID=A0A9P5LKW0_9HYPO|nr:hypothetical protein G7Z17_g1889 [Cylindrodendrum hubeiense]
MEQREGLEFNIPGNSYATAYSSRWTYHGSELVTPEDLRLLQHMNCSYLSSGRPVTLLALKQHAQSLTNLIRKLSLSSTAAAVRELGHEEIGWGFQENEAFDWLDNLREPYENEDETHHVPLHSLSNHIRGQSDDNGLQHHCPLSEVRDFGPWSQKDGTRRPYQTHHNLVMHANECLEILDHEYSSTGGLMSILPTDTEHDTVELAGARNSLLGQWLLHHQHLVGRMHELEINYANSIDILEGEATVPLQVTRRTGPDGMSQGREIAYPQDRYVLVNAGDDVTSHLHRLLDQAEAHSNQKERIWKNAGASGERIWQEERGGKWYARGIIPVDLLTRFYRVAGKGHGSPIFVLPAIEKHPGVAATRSIEKRPTVVSIVTPTWPKRVSEWEHRFKERLDYAKEVELENKSLVRDNIEIEAAMARKNEKLRRNRDELAFLKATSSEGVGKTQQSLLRRIAAYEAKMKELKSVLPSKYHSQLTLTVEDEETGEV